MRLQRTLNIGLLLSLSRSVVALRIELGRLGYQPRMGNQPSTTVLCSVARMGVEPISPP